MSAPIPQRIGKAERDAARIQLQGHLEAGRLTQAEFDDRSARLQESAYQADLDAQFADLGGLSTWTTIPRQGNPAFPGQELADLNQNRAGISADPAVPAAPVPGVVDPEAKPPNNVDRACTAVMTLVWPIAIALAFFTSLGWVTAMVGAFVITAICKVIQANWGRN